MYRNFNLDLLKILLAFMVVGIHAGFLYDINRAAHFTMVNGVFRVAVPLFFMINGYYFYTICNNDMFIKWIKRVAILYSLWMLLYSYYWFRPMSLGWDNILESIIVGYYHLWYIMAIIGAGVMTYAVRNSPKIAIAISILSYLLGVMIQYIGNYHIFRDTSIDVLFNTGYVHRNFLLFAFPFFFLGYYINKENNLTNIKTRFVFAIFIIGLFLLVMESWYNFTNPNHQDPWVDNCIFLFLVCPSLFILSIRSPLLYKGKVLSLVSTVIYLIHPFWIFVLTGTSNMSGTLLTILCFVLSILSSMILIPLNDRIKVLL